MTYIGNAGPPAIKKKISENLRKVEPNDKNLYQCFTKILAMLVQKKILDTPAPKESRGEHSHSHFLME